MASLLFCLSDLVELIGWNDVTMAFFVGALELSCLFFFFRSSGFGIKQLDDFHENCLT